MNMKHNERISGPFGMLPVLQWGPACVAQTEAIAGYLYTRLGHGGQSTDPVAAAERAAASAALTSLAHQDLIGMCIQLVGVMATFHGKASDADLAGPANQCYARINAILPRLESMLARRDAGAGGPPGGFLGPEPVMGDYFMYEALDMAMLVVGPSILVPFENLGVFHAWMSLRPRIAAYLSSGRRPLTMTGNPAEAEAIKRIRASLNTA